MSARSCSWVRVATATHAACTRGSLEESVRRLVGRLPGERRERRRQRLLSLGEARGDPRLDVDIRVELLDGRESDLLANVVVLDQIGCDPLDPALVEHRSLEGEGKHRDETDEQRQDSEGEGAPGLFLRARLRDRVVLVVHRETV